jgi:hypothetical protein
MSTLASCLELGETCLFTNLYAPTNISSKSLVWAHVRYIRSLDPLFMCIMVGEFNFVSCLKEKRDRWLGWTSLLVFSEIILSF